MPRRVITVSYTDLNAGGGVPAFNRALHATFPDRECLHFCWTDFPWHGDVDARGDTEWGRARTLNGYLVKSRLVSEGDVVIADGFWAAGLEHLPLAVSHSHGIWGHLTKEDVDGGKSPDMPLHHAAQVEFRRRWTGMGKHITAVSDFIAEQMRLQWGFEVDRVINNGVDTDDALYVLPNGRKTIVSKGYAPLPEKNKLPPDDKAKWGTVILHGINDPTNLNKGWDHILLLQKEFCEASVINLDEFTQQLIEPPLAFPDWHSARMCALGNADVVVHPSNFEGNSMFVVEALACGLPVVGYDVGYLWGVANELGTVIDRRKRSPEFTLAAVRDCLSNRPLMQRAAQKARELAVRDLSIEAFRQNWRSYVEEIEHA